ncbi:alpha/beta hydrolase [Leifsonia shinshuensis]|uniref:alpha/beta fold hydrolase n=1 Tax=Leifsonia shinshuensis TaxID=150026 RepID=UPI001F5042AE|nr:alpha/beta hydrolase [Leifsonia shinshuensis]MCI0157056.1 alpha/beta hydrolase [Leifsonia shinshuensis]
MSDARDRLAHVEAGELDVEYADVGPRDGPAVLLLHGWPYDLHSFDAAAALLAERGYRVLAPNLRGFGGTRFRSEGSARNGEQAVFATDAVAFLDALGIGDAVVAGFDWGARTANILAALWPDRCRGHVSVSGYLIGSQEVGAQPLPPAAELSWWYQFYFATERGRLGYDRNRSEFARLIWHTASPRWEFDEATFQRSAAAFASPDHVDIVIHNYRWRLGAADGQDSLTGLEQRLAGRPTIAVPTITLEGDANGAPHPLAETYRDRFTGPYEHREIAGGIGHDLPQEAPRAFADAIADVDAMARQDGDRAGMEAHGGR